MANHSQTSTGERLTDAQIKTRYAASRKKKYEGSIAHRCEGCGQPATCSAHIIPQARLKQLHKAELIYDPRAYFASCYRCNAAIENPKGQEWKQLRNIQICLEFIEMHDPELYSKFIAA